MWSAPCVLSVDGPQDPLQMTLSASWQKTRNAGKTLPIILGVGTLAGAVGSYIFAVIAGLDDTQRRGLYLTLGAVCVALPIISGGINQRRATRAERLAEQIEAEAEADMLVTLGSAFSPALHYLGRIATTSQRSTRRELGGHLAHAVVEAAVGLCGARQARSIFFRKRGNEMECECYAGRSEPSRTVFSDKASDPAGQEAFKVVHEANAIQYDDVEKVAPTGFPGSRSYRTFISVAVVAGDTGYGMLTVDAPEPNSFGEQDLEVMKTLANLLGVGLALIRVTEVRGCRRRRNSYCGPRGREPRCPRRWRRSYPLSPCAGSSAAAKTGSTSPRPGERLSRRRIETWRAVKPACAGFSALPHGTSSGSAGRSHRYCAGERQRRAQEEQHRDASRPRMRKPGPDPPRTALRLENFGDLGILDVAPPVPAPHG